MMKPIRLAALLAGASAVLSAPALAQVRDLDGESSDVRVFQGEVDGAAAIFRLTVPADTTLQIDVLARDGFDPVVRVLDDDGVLIVEDDDGGDDLNPRARVSAEDTDRNITIEVDGFDAEWADGDTGYGGSFDLRLSSMDYAPLGTRAVAYGARETGIMAGEEHLFTVQGREGELLEVAMLAEDDGLDPYLELRDASGEAIAADDDGGAGLNSYLRTVLPAAGTYTIAASGYSETSGAYVLRVRDRRENVAQLPQQVIGLNDPASGELASAYESDSLGLGHIDYRLSEEAIAAIRSGASGITIRMNAAADGDADFGGSLDPFVELGLQTPLGFAVVDSDDDGSGSLDSLLPVDLSAIAQDAEMLAALRIRAKGVSGSAGAYTLEVTPGLEPRAEDAWTGEDIEIEAE